MLRIALLVLCACGRLHFDVAAQDAPADMPMHAAICDGREQPVPPSGVIGGTLAAATSGLEGTCGGAGATELVYAVELPAGAELLAASDGPSSIADTVMYVRTNCLDAATEQVCDVGGGIGDFASRRVTGLEPGGYYVIFDGDMTQNMGTGVVDGEIAYLLPEGAACLGNAARDRCGADLTCDPTNTCVPATCTVAETFTATGTYNRTTTTLTATPSLHSGSCGEGNDGGIRAPETVYRAQLATAVSDIHVSTAFTTSDFDTLVYVRDGCHGVEIECDDDGGSTMTTPLKSDLHTGPLPAGDYFIFIDGFSLNAGTATVLIDIVP